MPRSAIFSLLLLGLPFSANAALLDVNYEFTSTTHNVLDTNVLGVSYQVDSSEGVLNSFVQFGYEILTIEVSDAHNPVVSLPANNEFHFISYFEQLTLLRDIDKTSGAPTGAWRNFGGTGPYSIRTYVRPESQPGSNYFFQGGNATGYILEDWGSQTSPLTNDAFSISAATITDVAPPPPVAGESPTNPITNTTPCAATNGTGCFVIPISVDPNGVGGISPVFIDPVVAIGYEYTVSAASVFFDTVLIPEQGGLLNGAILELLIAGLPSLELIVGTTFDFDVLSRLNLDRFTIQGIDPALGLVPGDATAFVTGLTFIGNDGNPLPGQTDVGVTMNAITRNDVSSVPAPATLMLLLPAFGYMRFARQGRRG